MKTEKPRLRPLKSRLARDLMYCPELERFLSREHVDLAVTDQLQSLQVRVREGVGILERRVARCSAALAHRARTLRAWLLAFCVAGACTLPGMPLSPPTTSWAIGTACVVILIVLGIRLGYVLHDRNRLGNLVGRYEGRLDTATTADELLSFAESVLDDAHTLAGNSGPASHSQPR